MFCIYETHAVAAASSVVASFFVAASVVASLSATVSFVGSGSRWDEAEGALDASGSRLLLDFSLLKTLLILFTYLPKLIRRSAFLASDGPESAGDAIVNGCAFEMAVKAKGHCK